MTRQPAKSKPRKSSGPGRVGARRTTTRRTRGSRSAPAKTVRRPAAGSRSRPEHKREITALVLVGVAVFVFVALYGGDAAGSAGRGVRTGLVYAFGVLAFLIPLALVASAATMVFRGGSGAFRDGAESY